MGALGKHWTLSPAVKARRYVRFMRAWKAKPRHCSLATKRKLSKAHRAQAKDCNTPETSLVIRKKISKTMKLLRRGRERFYVSCLLCKKEFLVQKHRSKIAKYCSRDCCSKAKVKPKKVVGFCLRCKEELVGKKGKKFCSRKCYFVFTGCPGGRGGGGLVEATCFECGEKFQIKKWLYENRIKKGYLFCSTSCSFSRRLYQKAPNKWEKKLKRLLKPFGFRYVGNAKFRVGRKFPDFVHKTKSMLIELFGEYWHNKSEVRPRISYFKKYGFSCLVIWASELTRSAEAVRRRVEKFMLRNSGGLCAAHS
jgi:G:T-mismatch repair DNA endonuclease (very short patch repair protein)